MLVGIGILTHGHMSFSLFCFCLGGAFLSPPSPQQQTRRPFGTNKGAPSGQLQWLKPRTGLPPRFLGISMSCVLTYGPSFFAGFVTPICCQGGPEPRKLPPFLRGGRSLGVFGSAISHPSGGWQALPEAPRPPRLQGTPKLVSGNDLSTD